MAELSPKVCPGCGARFDAKAVFCQRDGERLVKAAPPHGPDPFVGRVLLDQFLIEGILGAGGMGTVYRARQTTVDRDVAIKILHPELATNEDAVRRFHREAKVSSQLDHPNVVRVFLFGQLPGEDSLYLVMQHLDGRSLASVAAEAPLPLPRALHIVSQICAGIGDAHAHGVVHRDVKPENIFLIEKAGDPDFVKVLDFGIARFLEGEQTVATQSGLIFGTARYISPEAASGEPTDARSDVYSIGVLAYQLLAGHTPFDSKSPVSLLMKHIHEAPPQLRKAAPRVPERIADLVMRCLIKNPDGRPADAVELARAFFEAADAEGISLGDRRSLMPAIATRKPAAAPAAIPVSAPRERTTAPTGPLDPSAPAAAAAASPDVAASSYSGDPSVDLVAAGLPKRGGAFRTLAIAFVVGAVLAGGGAWAFTQQASGPTVEALEHEARAALAQGDLDGEGASNVLALTDRMLAADGDHRPAWTIRREAARRLREEASTALAQGYPSETEALLRRALTFDPESEETRGALEALEEPVEPVEVVSPSLVVVSGDEADIGDTVTVILEAPGQELPSAARLAVRVGSRTVARRQLEAQGAGRWSASYRIPVAARYVFSLDDAGLDELSAELTTRRRSGRVAQSAPAPSPRRAPSPMTMTSPAVNTANDDGIDWRVPGTDTRRNPPVFSRPLPAPPPSMTPTSRPVPMRDEGTHVFEPPPAPWMSGSVL